MATENDAPKMKALRMVNISSSVFGKYQYCTKASNGLWYADSDMAGRKAKRGALPSPSQDTEEKTIYAKNLHRKSAERATRKALGTPTWGDIYRENPIGVSEWAIYGAALFVFLTHHL